ncbi:hypothetical protein ES706_04298 [subsurface metagenome]
MFCRNCGKELIGSPEMCPECGAKPMSSTSFCPNCGAATTELTEICPKCGARVTGKVVEKVGGAWMPLTAGILDLVAGAIGVIVGIFVALIGGLATFFVGGVGATYGVVAIILAVVPIVGGVFAIKRAKWGLVLAGSICALIAGMLLLNPLIIILAIAAIVFTILGKKHFT